MGERERLGGRDGLLATQMISLSSLSFSFSRCVCAYISERERERRRRQRETEREGDRCEEAIFYLDFCPADSLKIYFVALASFASFAFRLFFIFFFVFFVNAFLPSSSQKEHTRKEEEEEEDFRLSLLFPSFLCEIKPFVSFIVPLLLRIRIRVQNTTPTMLGRLTEWLATSAKCEEAPDKVTHENLGREKRGRERVGFLSVV